MRVKQKNRLRCTLSFEVNGVWWHRVQSFPPHFEIFGLPPKYLPPSPPPFLPDDKSHFPCFPLPSFLPYFLNYSRFLACSLALAVSHPTVGVAIVFFKDLSSCSSSSDDSLITRVCLSSLSRAMTWTEGFLPDGQFQSLLPLVVP